MIIGKKRKHSQSNLMGLEFPMIRMRKLNIQQYEEIEKTSKLKSYHNKNNNNLILIAEQDNSQISNQKDSNISNISVYNDSSNENSPNLSQESTVFDIVKGISCIELEKKDEILNELIYGESTNNIVFSDKKNNSTNFKNNNSNHNINNFLLSEKINSNRNNFENYRYENSNNIEVQVKKTIKFSENKFTGYSLNNKLEGIKKVKKSNEKIYNSFNKIDNKEKFSNPFENKNNLLNRNIRDLNNKNDINKNFEKNIINNNHNKKFSYFDLKTETRLNFKESFSNLDKNPILNKKNLFNKISSYNTNTNVSSSSNLSQLGYNGKRFGSFNNFKNENINSLNFKPKEGSNFKNNTSIDSFDNIISQIANNQKKIDFNQKRTNFFKKQDNPLNEFNKKIDFEEEILLNTNLNFNDNKDSKEKFPKYQTPKFYDILDDTDKSSGFIDYAVTNNSYNLSNNFEVYKLLGKQKKINVENKNIYSNFNFQMPLSIQKKQEENNFQKIDYKIQYENKNKINYLKEEISHEGNLNNQKNYFERKERNLSSESGISRISENNNNYKGTMRTEVRSVIRQENKIKAEEKKIFADYQKHMEEKKKKVEEVKTIQELRKNLEFKARPLPGFYKK